MVVVGCLTALGCSDSKQEKTAAKPTAGVSENKTIYYALDEAEDIKDIHIIINKPHTNLLEPKDVKYRPKALAQAKFSIPYILALTAVEGEVVLDSFKEDKLEDAKLLAAADKVSWEMRPEEKPENFVDDQVKKLREKLKGKKVLLALSGGVDSSV